jgi:VIT1/CCC1 family predicted Fe2+/Mn2+ transporter
MSGAEPKRTQESHRGGRMAWVRAAVLGANDGLISTSSLVVGVAAAGPSRVAILLTGVAGLTAGALSMAAGEYVSVGSQADAERADLALERRELATQPVAERAELASIYVARGLDPTLADRVAEGLMAHDALGAHARDELGITEIHRARPVQAALASAASFAVGAVLPLIMVLVAPRGLLTWLVVALSLVCLSTLGAIASRAGGAKAWLGAVRVTFWGALAMAITYGVGVLFKVTV